LQNEREWKVFCEQVLLQPALTLDPRFDSNKHRHEHRDQLKALIAQAFSDLTTQQVVDRLEQAQIANARMNDMADLWAHPQLRARDRWRDIQTPAGPVPALLPPGRNTAFEARMDPIPAVGEHTAALLREIGWDEHRISLLNNPTPSTI
ncbi:MAG: CoA transferase, partial [Limnohabitans sp.]